MRFSRRTGWERGANELSGVQDAARARGALDLTESNPTRAGLAADPRELAEALTDPGNVLHEPEPLGLPSARAAVASWLAARGVDVPPGRVVLTASTSEAYSLLFKLACDPGDVVAIPQPSYPLFDMLAGLEAVETVSYRLRPRESGWRLDVDRLASELPERARAIVVVHPNNPTGSMLAADEIEALAALCRERELVLISDEVFADFRWSGQAPSSLLPLASRAGGLVVALGGLSKACGLPQLKLGWMALGGGDGHVGEALARLDLACDAYLSVGTPVQRGLPRLLEMGESFRARASERILGNRRVLEGWAARAGCRLLPCEAGWQAILELPPERDEQAMAMDLARRGVIVQPGWFFDMAGSHLVLSLLPEPPIFQRGLEMLLAGEA